MINACFRQNDVEVQPIRANEWGKKTLKFLCIYTDIFMLYLPNFLSALECVHVSVQVVL